MRTAIICALELGDALNPKWRKPDLPTSIWLDCAGGFLAQTSKATLHTTSRGALRYAPEEIKCR